MNQRDVILDRIFIEISSTRDLVKNNVSKNWHHIAFMFDIYRKKSQGYMLV